MKRFPFSLYGPDNDLRRQTCGAAKPSTKGCQNKAEARSRAATKVDEVMCVRSHAHEMTFARVPMMRNESLAMLATMTLESNENLSTTNVQKLQKRLA